MQEYTTNNPAFNDALELFDTTTPGHADNFNRVNKSLFENTMYLYKKMQEVHETKVFQNLSEMISALNVMQSEALKVGDNIFIVDADVPDFWIMGIQGSSEEYQYTNDDMLINDLLTNGTIHCGYFALARLEIGKIDLSSIQNDIQELQKQLSGAVQALSNI